MKLTRREFAVGMTTAIASMTLPRLASAQSPLVVPTYGGLWAKFWEEKLLPGLTSATGIQPQLDVGLGKDFVAKIRAGGGRSPYSIFMGNENIAAVLRAEGFFEPFDLAKVPNAAKTFPQFINKDAKGIRAIVSPIGLAYRTDLVKTAPRSAHAASSRDKNAAPRWCAVSVYRQRYRWAASHPDWEEVPVSCPSCGPWNSE